MTDIKAQIAALTDEAVLELYHVEYLRDKQVTAEQARQKILGMAREDQDVLFPAEALLEVLARFNTIYDEFLQQAMKSYSSVTTYFTVEEIRVMLQFRWENLASV